MTDPQVTGFFRERFDPLSASEKNARLSAIENKLVGLLNSRLMRLSLGSQDSVSLRRHLNEEAGNVVLVALGTDRPQQAAVLSALMLSALQSAILARASQPERQRVDCSILVDEFSLLAGLEEFRVLSAQNRRLSAQMTIAHQSLAQLDARLLATLRSNLGVSILLPTSNVNAGILARDVASGEPPETVRANLIRGRPGQAYLVRRGQASLRIQIPRCETPAVGRDAAQALTEAAWRTWARPAADIEREVAARYADAPSQPTSNQLGTSGTTHTASPAPPPILEVHDLDAEPSERPKRRRGKAAP